MKKFLNVQQKEALLSQPIPRFATELRNLVFLHLSLNNGVQMENLLNLAWNQIDISGRDVLVSVPKSDVQERMAIRSKSLVSLLNEWKEKQLLEWRNDSFAPNTPDERPGNVFTDLDGRPLNKEYMSKMLIMYARCAGINDSVLQDFLDQTADHVKDV